jgi:hypothetical protein
MAIIQNPVTPSVLGQSISGDFGKQFSGLQSVGAPIVAPTALPANVGGVNKTVLEACARGELPRNAQLSTISGVSVSAGISQSQGDGMSVEEGMSCGNGSQVCLGVAVAPNAQNPNSVTTAGINTQLYVEGTANANDALSTGPTPTNNESVISAPMSGATTLANIALLVGIYQG